MDTMQKISMLGEAAVFDLCRGCGTQTSRIRDDIGSWIYPAVTPDGRSVRLLKVLQSNVCEKDCHYCANRAQRDVRRVSFTPDELAASFAEMVRRRQADGLFLSSGVCGSVARATDRMLATVELVRKRYQFGGYIHLKILPGADDASIEASIRLADRVSVNLEAPNEERLRRLSGTKAFGGELVSALQRAHRLRSRSERHVSMTTQYVVGAAGETDGELLQTSSRLYQQLGLARAYYSAFRPIDDTPLEDVGATPLWREHRLYQADFLLRCYGFSYGELVLDAAANLPREHDPKTAYALAHPERFPLEVNRASREELLRVPGIGPVSATRIVEWRRQGTLRDLGQLQRAGARSAQAAPYILLDGRRQTHQLALPGLESA